MFRLFDRPKHKGERGEVLPEPHDGLPDTFRLGGLCPRCGKQSSFEYAGSLPFTVDETCALNRDGTQEP